MRDVAAIFLLLIALIAITACADAPPVPDPIAPNVLTEYKTAATEVPILRTPWPELTASLDLEMPSFVKAGAGGDYCESRADLEKMIRTVRLAAQRQALWVLWADDKPKPPLQETSP